MAGFSAGQPVHHGHVLHSAADSVRAVLPALYVHGPGGLAPGLLRRGGHRRQRQGVSEKLHRRVHGGGRHRPGLPDLLRFPVQQHPGGGCHPTRRHNGVAVHRPADFQYADPHRPCQRGGSHCKGDVGAIKKLIPPLD